MGIAAKKRAGVGISARLAAEKECTLRLTWHHECGFTLVVQPRGRPAQVLRRRYAWRAYGQKYVPFSIGGMADKDSPRLSRWVPGLAGWVKGVRVWAAPQEVPGPVQLDVAGAPIRAPFAPVAGIKVLDLDDPPIKPDPLGLVSLPDRPLSDLRLTREVGELDRVISRCKSEVDVFSCSPGTSATRGRTATTGRGRPERPVGPFGSAATSSCR